MLQKPTGGDSSCAKQVWEGFRCTHCSPFHAVLDAVPLCLTFHSVVGQKLLGFYTPARGEIVQGLTKQFQPVVIFFCKLSSKTCFPLSLSR